jgi:hypothetical protein
MNPIRLPATVMRFCKTEIRIEYLVRKGSAYEWSPTGDPHVFETELEIEGALALHGGAAATIEKPPEPKPCRHSPAPAEGRRDWMSKWEQEHEG